MPTKTPPVTILGEEIEIRFKDVDINRTETGTIQIPADMPTREAIFWLSTKVTMEEQTVAVNERIEGFPIDVAHALQLAVKDMFGIRELRSEQTFFGETPPTFITVPIDAAGNTVEVFQGNFSLPGVAGVLKTIRDANDALWIQGKVQQKSIPKLRD